MSKEVQMTFRVEPKLRAEFSDAVLLEDRPAAQVLREFMRAYVSQSHERIHSPANDVISPVESRDH
jgi:hypothetical protein